MKRHCLTLIGTLLIATTGWTQGDYYQNIGKIYVVVAVAAVLVAGIGGFLFYLDRRISKMEKQIEDDSRS